jgi:adenylosuccinate synthase
MTEKIYVVTDLGPGDGGKGGVVHKVANMAGAHTIIKVGGAQGSHGVRTSKGESFAFSQWGCGTLEGIRTHISPRLVVSPIGLLNEADMIEKIIGISNPFDLLTIDETAICATSYHGIASRLKELARGNDPRGTIGTGVGEAYRYSKSFPELTILAGELASTVIRDKLSAVRRRVKEELKEIIDSNFLSDDRKEADEEIALLDDDLFFERIVIEFQKVAKLAKIVDCDFLRREILSQDGVAVIESSHGILTDNAYGFHPHTSALRTLPCFTHEMLKEAGYEGRIVNIGVHRAYEIRHGAGPMPTANPKMADNLLPGSNKEENRYQGKVRVGPLDLSLMRYAIDVCGEPRAFDGLAITWFDQIKINGQWQLCDRYRNADDQNFFTPQGEIKINRGEGDGHMRRQEELGKKLLGCLPEISTIKIPKDADEDKLFSLCADVLGESLKVPVRMVSIGPTELDKICK